jgi:hypothetical protein
MDNCPSLKDVLGLFVDFLAVFFRVVCTAVEDFLRPEKIEKEAN